MIWTSFSKVELFLLQLNHQESKMYLCRMIICDKDLITKVIKFICLSFPYYLHLFTFLLTIFVYFLDDFNNYQLHNYHGSISTYCRYLNFIHCKKLVYCGTKSLTYSSKTFQRKKFLRLLVRLKFIIFCNKVAWKIL